MIRNNLRVLEQKLNASTTLSEADKIEWQQYITRCYLSLPDHLQRPLRQTAGGRLLTHPSTSAHP